MNQQIKLNNKNNNEVSNQVSIKIRFQSNIFKYVEKKKRELSVFSALNQKQRQKNTGEKNSATCSNLISKNTQTNFYRQVYRDEQNILSAIKVNLADRNQRAPLIRKQAKGHKSSLSDWRQLYGQRDGIVEKNKMGNSSPDKMVVTDRLFYPSKKNTNPNVNSNINPNFENQQLKRVSAQPYRSSQINQGKKPIDTAKQQQKYFVSDQNFFHMYYRSKTPIMSEFAQSQRIVKYFKQNKHRRQSSHGLRLMNEAIFSPSSSKERSFIPYKKQSSQNYSQKHQKQHKNKSLNQTSLNSKKYYQFNDPEVKLISQLNDLEVKQNPQHFKKLSNILSTKNAKLDSQIHKDNPQSLKSKKSKLISGNKAINLADICSNNSNSILKNQQIRQIHLKLFKPRRNKVEKGIFNFTQNNMGNFEGSLNRIQERKTFSNWSNMHGQY